MCRNVLPSTGEMGQTQIAVQRSRQPYRTGLACDQPPEQSYATVIAGTSLPLEIAPIRVGLRAIIQCPVIGGRDMRVHTGTSSLRSDTYLRPEFGACRPTSFDCRHQDARIRPAIPHINHVSCPWRALVNAKQRVAAWCGDCEDALRLPPANRDFLGFPSSANRSDTRADPT